MPNTFKIAFAAIAALAVFVAAPLKAYWEYGHETVAKIAFASVQPETRAELRRLMRQDALLQTPDCRANTIEAASYWPDCVKPYGDRYAYAFRWHFQNVDICKEFDLSGPCANGDCVAAQIERHARMLADRDLPDRVRLESLTFLVHFVGDLHQPLHAGDNDDLGGNRVSANYGLIGGRTNLHSIWDGFLAERAISTPPRGIDGWLSGLDAGEIDRIKSGDVVDWSREMWEQSRDVAYPTLIDADPCDGKVEGRPTLTEEDVQRLIPIARQNVVHGGLRLARLLDDAILRGEAPEYRRF
ncbi:S1/P1 nuclease [Sphingomicrobium clamense]|uniref:S1/P1 nuclease n=1 Tax=Sphingomicrobium clamense TaxID=2851013 RepID=A0ABS6V434_9SPHN|nr:S1/P1 nuclease [Sphingomicrobium sp. B8]MBW0143843.1 S1/P1 nuclease [Sphingomicrobium sp. B8]